MTDAPIGEPHALHLCIDLTAGGSWRLSVIRAGDDDVRARLDPRRVRRLRADLADAARGDLAAAERARSTLFEASAALAGVVGEARGLARARQVPLCLVIEASDPSIAELPYEALEAAPPGVGEATQAPGPAPAPETGPPGAAGPDGAAPEAAASEAAAPEAAPPEADSALDPAPSPDRPELIIIRLAGHRSPPLVGPRRGPATRLCLSPDAPASARAALEALCARHDLPLPVDLDVPPPLGHACVLYVADASATLAALRPTAPPGPPRGPTVTLSLDPTPADRAHAPRDHAHPAALRAALAAADLVVLADADRPHETITRALAADARAVLTLPSDPRDARLAALAGLYRALADGRSLATAAAAARAAYARSTHRPGPTLTVTHPALAGRRLVGAERRPVGWPVPNADAARLIEAAWQIAEITECGYLGVEHLALALADADPRPRLRRLRYQLRARRRHIESRLAAYTPRRARTAPKPTPRLAALGAHLADDFDPEALWQLIVDRAGDTLRVLLGDHDTLVQPQMDGPAAPDLELVTAPQTDRDERPALALELVTGPEDGRRLALAPGEALGRASGSHKARHRLYDDTALTDPALSRRHLIWRGPGHVEICTATRHPRSGAGPRDLTVGTLIGLTHCTWIRGTL